jgi:molecular chaperone GrpE
MTHSEESIHSDTAETEVLPPETDSAAESRAEDAAAAEAAKYKDLYLRSQADFDNFRKRAGREKEDAIRYSNSALLERLLPILDNFELGLDAAKQSADASGIIQGMSMVQKQLGDFLQEHGVEVLNTEGHAFDPNFHEAVGQEVSTDVAEGIVLRQLRRGFKLRDRLLRPATVIVSKGSAE